MVTDEQREQTMRDVIDSAKDYQYALDAQLAQEGKSGFIAAHAEQRRTGANLTRARQQAQLAKNSDAEVNIATQMGRAIPEVAAEMARILRRHLGKR